MAVIYTRVFADGTKRRGKLRRRRVRFDGENWYLIFVGLKKERIIPSGEARKMLWLWNGDQGRLDFDHVITTHTSGTWDVEPYTDYSIPQS